MKTHKHDTNNENIYQDRCNWQMQFYSVKHILPFFAPTGHNLYSNYAKNDTGKSPLRDL